MIENALRIVVIIVVLVFGLIVGTLTSGIEDYLWLAVNDIIPECDKMEDEAKKACKNLNSAYYTGKSMFFVIGLFGTISPIYTALYKIGLFD